MDKLSNKTAARKARPIRILQFGEGNFLRAFADWMIDIANEHGVMDAGVAVVAPRFGDKPAIRSLRAQDGLYHVMLEGIADGKPARENRLVSVIERVLSPTVDYQEYIDTILLPDLQVVISNTTEAGIKYEKDDATADLPATFPGKVANLLWRRWKAFGGDPEKGLVFVCCELIEDNGSRLRECVLRQAEENGMGQDFIGWVKDSCVFCDSLVDRIVSGFPADSIAEATVELGYDDEMVVKGELYHLWVIGGEGYERARQLLPLDRAGLHVEFLPSVKEFRDKKVRILNGSHTGMTPIALQMGCETVREAFDNPLVNKFVCDMVEREALPMIDGDRAELKAFADGILERFYNPYIRHQLKSIALNSLSKWEARNLPTASDFYKRTGKHAEHEAFALAALLTLYNPASGFEPDDEPVRVAAIREAWATGDCQAVAEAAMGHLESQMPGFLACVSAHMRDIMDKGMAQALADFLSENE